MPRAFNLAYVHGDTATGATATGTTSATALSAPADHVEVTTVTTTNNGIILRAGAPGETRTVVNADATESLKVYPPSGAAFNGYTADIPVVLPAYSAASFRILTSTKIAATF